MLGHLMSYGSGGGGGARWLHLTSYYTPPQMDLVLLHCNSNPHGAGTGGDGTLLVDNWTYTNGNYGTMHSQPGAWFGGVDMVVTTGGPDAPDGGIAGGGYDKPGNPWEGGTGVNMV